MRSAARPRRKGIGLYHDRVFWAIAGSVVVVLGIPALWLVVTYNGLVTARVRARNGFSQIDVQLKRRCDLIPNLVEAVRGYMAHERDTLDRVTQARAAALGALGALARNPADAAALHAAASASGTLDALLARISVSIEAYPQLKASQNVLALQEELVSTENRIAFARQAYNDAVMRLNTAIAVFPSNIVARMFGFAEMALFEAEDAARAVPAVSFGSAGR